MDPKKDDKNNTKKDEPSQLSVGAWIGIAIAAIWVVCWVYLYFSKCDSLEIAYGKGPSLALKIILPPVVTLYELFRMCKGETVQAAPATGP
jgi:hypothetical protein